MKKGEFKAKNKTRIMVESFRPELWRASSSERTPTARFSALRCCLGNARHIRSTFPFFAAETYVHHHPLYPFLNFPQLSPVTSCGGTVGTAESFGYNSLGQKYFLNLRCYSWDENFDRQQAQMEFDDLLLP